MSIREKYIMIIRSSVLGPSKVSPPLTTSVFTFIVWSLGTFSKHQWMSVGATFPPQWRNSLTYLLHTHFRIRCHFDRLSLCCHLSHLQQNWTECWQVCLRHIQSVAQHSQSCSHFLPHAITAAHLHQLFWPGLGAHIHCSATAKHQCVTGTV